MFVKLMEKVRSNETEVRELYLREGVQSVADYLGISRDRAEEILKYLNIHDVGVRIVRSKIAHQAEVKSTGFTNKEHYNYLLGYIQGDGHLTQPRNTSSCYCTIVTTDIDHAQEICRVFDLTYKISKVERYGVKCKDQARILIHHPDFIERLKRDGIVPDKSKADPILNISKGCENAVIRGLLDSDGCVTVTNERSGNHYVKLVWFGTKALINQISTIFPESVKISVSDYLPSGSERNLSVLRIGSRESVRCVYDWLYSEGCLYMKRKKNIMDKYYKVSI